MERMQYGGKGEEEGQESHSRCGREGSSSGEHTGSLKVEGTVLAESRIHGKRICRN